MSGALASKLREGIVRLGLPTLPDGAEERLLKYLNLLVKWNAAYNLTAIRQPEQMLVRHILDSLSILPRVEGQTLIDIGTGAGLPGLVLAAARSDLKTTLLDSNGKKVRFLRQAIAELELANVEAVQSRTEQYAGSFDVVTSRAFATLADMVEWGAHLLAERGSFLAMKGMRPVEEMAVLPQGFKVKDIVSLQVPFLEEERHLICIVRQ